MLFFFILISTFFVSTIDCQINDGEGLPTAAFVLKNEVRKAEIEEYSLNILANINRPLILNTTKDSNVITWSLIQHKNDFSQSENQKPHTLTLFNALESKPRNSTISSKFLCLPDENKCSSLKIENFSLDYLGTYSYQIQLNNSLKNALVDFNISAHMDHLDFKCHSSNDCFHNESNKFLTVLAGKSISLECSIMIIQNSNFTPAAELAITSDINKFDQCDLDTRIELIPLSDVHLYLNSSSNIRIYLFKISKRCKQVFNKEFNGNNLKCELKPVNQPVPSELQSLGVIKTATNKINVHYDPVVTQNSNQVLNKTIFYDQAETFNFSCPIESNPEPTYQWRIKKVQYNKTNEKGIFLTPTEFSNFSKEFLIRKDLEIGYYEFECRARTEGLVGKFSNPVTFILNIQNRDKETKETKNKTGIIVGSTVGGIIGILLISLVIFFLVRRSKSKGFEDGENPKIKIYNPQKKAMNVVKENQNKSDRCDECVDLKSNRVDQNNEKK